MIKQAVNARFVKDGVRNTRADVPMYTPEGKEVWSENDAGEEEKRGGGKGRRRRGEEGRRRREGEKEEGRRRREGEKEEGRRRREGKEKKRGGGERLTIYIESQRQQCEYHDRLEVEDSVYWVGES